MNVSFDNCCFFVMSYNKHQFFRLQNIKKMNAILVIAAVISALNINNQIIADLRHNITHRLR